MDILDQLAVEQRHALALGGGLGPCRDDTLRPGDFVGRGAVARIDDSIRTLSGAQYFCTMDMASGYWQVELDEDAKEKSAFVVHCGLYQFCKMPFGLCNASSTFERLGSPPISDLSNISG